MIHHTLAILGATLVFHAEPRRQVVPSLTVQTGAMVIGDEIAINEPSRHARTITECANVTRVVVGCTMGAWTLDGEILTTVRKVYAQRVSQRRIVVQDGRRRFAFLLPPT